MPLSAEKGRNVDTLIKAATLLLPVGTPMFQEDEITDRSERFLASEFLREKLFRLLGEVKASLHRAINKRQSGTPTMVGDTE